MAPRKCAWKCYFRCKTNATLHRFPNPQSGERFLLWTRVLDPNTQKKTSGYIYNNLRLCDNHFESGFITPSKQLTRNAYPTLNLELYRDPDLDPDEESGAIYKEQVEESIVPETKTFTWENKNEAVCIKPELYRDPDLDPDEESGAIYKEQVEESIVPETKTFTWENKNEAICIKPGPQIFLHWFPKPGKDIARFRAWVHAIGGEILSLSNENIYKIRRVCHAHFEEKYCCRNNRISKIAVPTLLMPDSASKFTHSGRIPLKDIENVASTSEEVCDAADNESLHKDDKEPSSPHLDVKYDEVGDAADNESLYLDDSEPSLPHLDVRYDVDPTLHEGFQCDVCKGEIVGFRYTCVQCNDFDLCSSCEANKAHHHHYVLRVPQRRPYAEIQLVLATIRRHLMQNLDPITDFDEDLNDNLSIKSEIKSEIEVNDEEISSQDLSHSADKSTPPQPQEQTDHQEDHIEMNSQEETESYDQIMEQNITSSSKSTLLIQNEQLKRTCSKPKPPIMLSTAKKKILIKLDDFIKVKDGIPSAKKIRVLPIAKNKSDDKTQTALTHKPQFKPVNKMMFLKLPGAILKDAPKVPIQNLPLSIAMKHSADVDNE